VRSIRARRLTLGLSQRELGRLAGVSGNTIGRMEAGRSARPQSVTAVERILTERERDRRP